MAEIENNEEIKAPSNFIHDFIDEDLAKFKPVFRLNQTVISI